MKGSSGWYRWPPSSLLSPTISYGDCRGRMHSVVWIQRNVRLSCLSRVYVVSCLGLAYFWETSLQFVWNPTETVWEKNEVVCHDCKYTRDLEYSNKQTKKTLRAVFVLKARPSWVNIELQEWKRLRALTVRVLFNQTNKQTNQKSEFFDTSRVEEYCVFELSTSEYMGIVIHCWWCFVWEYFLKILGHIVWSLQTGTWHWRAFVVPISGCSCAGAWVRENGVETEKNRDKSSNCDVCVTCDDVRCLIYTVLELN